MGESILVAGRLQPGTCKFDGEGSAAASPSPRARHDQSPRALARWTLTSRRAANAILRASLLVAAGGSATADGAVVTAPDAADGAVVTTPDAAVRAALFAPAAAVG